MMQSRRPSAGELEILQVLWDKGPSTVRDVHAHLNQSKPTGYTTVLKLMQIMADKGLVQRDETQRAHVYEARIQRGYAQSQMVTDLVERAFGGSAARLVMHALSSKKSSAAELAEIRRTLDEMEGRLK
jgi:BlaI family transcriptional regulator, penicillinase repressor